MSHKLLCAIYIYIHIYMLLKVKFLEARKKTYGKPTLRLVPHAFVWVVVVVTTGVGVVILLISYFRNFSEMENSCVQYSWSNPKNVKG